MDFHDIAPASHAAPSAAAAGPPAKMSKASAEPAPVVVCQAEGTCLAAALVARQQSDTSAEQERLRLENEQLRKALDHERKLLKGMVDNHELKKEVPFTATRPEHAAFGKNVL